MAYTLNSAKELVAGKLPILLVDVLFLDGSTLYLSTRDVTWGGHVYQGRLEDADLAAIQAMSESGVDIPPSLTLHVADADRTIYQTWEVGKGFRGAKVTVHFTFYDALAAEFASDSIVRYIGICDPACPVDATRLEVRTTHRLNASKRMLPGAILQKHCWKIRPRTAAQCLDAINEDSDFWPCGITDPGAAECNNTREGCLAASNIERFSGLTYSPPRDGGKGREYTSGQWVQLFNSGNDAKYGEPWPVVLGKAWVECPVLNMRQDGNYTRCDVGLTVGVVDTGYSATASMRVVCNGVQLPPAGYHTVDGGGGYTWHQLNPGNVGWWTWVSPGLRNGWGDDRFNGQGDSYGSEAVIEIVVPRNVSAGEEVPRVSILFAGPKVRVYSDANTYTEQWTDNPVWHLLWALVSGNWRYDELDLASFVTAAAVCDETITYTSQYGGVNTHKRFRSNVALRQRRPAGDIIRGVRQNIGALLQPNRATGKLSVIVKGTLAAQQPDLASVPGTNYTTPVASKTRAGIAANGYVAYDFTVANTISITGISRPIQETPNRIAFQFQDSENNFAPTSIAIVDSDDVERVGQEVGGNLSVDGCASYDQANRLSNLWLKETLRGNARGDTGGTDWFTIQTSVRALRVGLGQICRATWAPLGLTNQLVRVMAVKGPDRNGVITLTVHRHSDDWYVDSANQKPDPAYSNARRNKLERASFPCCPDLIAPDVSDPMYSETDKTFAVTPAWTLGPDGKWNGKIAIRSKVAVNEFGDAQPPQIGLQANTAAIGGSIPAGLYYLAVAAKDSNGKLSPLSLVSSAFLASGATNTITIPVQWWDTATSGYRVYAGRTPFRLTQQADVAGTAANITITAYAECASGAPDQELDALVAVGRVVTHSGSVGTRVAAVGANSLTIGGTWTENALAGYDCSIIAKGDNSELPVLNFRITANTTDGVLTVTPDPQALSVDVEDVFILRCLPTVSDAGKTLTDPMWQNSWYPGGCVPDNEIGKILLIIAGAGRGQAQRVTAATATSHTVGSDWAETPDSTSRYIIVEPNWLPLDSPMRPIANSDPATVASFSFPIENYANRTLLIGLETRDGGDNAAVEGFMPLREFYVIGQPEQNVTVTTDYTQGAQDQNIWVDTTAGNVAITLLPAASWLCPELLIKKVTADANTVTVTPAGAETIESAVTLSQQWDYLALKRG